MQLPDLYFFFVWHPEAKPIVFHRTRAGTISPGTLPDLRPVPGSLVVHGPGVQALDPATLAFFTEARDEEGAVLPLASLLGRLGISRRIKTEELAAALGGEQTDIADPKILGREILHHLALALESFEDQEPEAPGPRADVRLDIEAAPDRPGVYTFLSSEGRTLYVGKARSLRRRLSSHFRARGGEPEKRATLVRDAALVRWEETGSELEALLREHLAFRREAPRINVQRTAHRRPRGEWRDRRVALLLPSISAGHHEVCLVAGDGRFHWERVPRGDRLPRGLWPRVVSFMEGKRQGWGPGERKRLPASLSAELAEITLSWLVLYGSKVTQIDLTREEPTLELKERFGRWLAQDPAEGRVEIR